VTGGHLPGRTAGVGSYLMSRSGKGILLGLVLFVAGGLLGFLGVGFLLAPRRQADPIHASGAPEAASAPATSPADLGWDSSLGAPPRFADVAGSAGIDFRHENGMAGKCLYPETMGAGVGLFDYDGDGRIDLYFVNGNRLDRPTPEITNRLYRNEGDWRFSDATVRAGVGDPGFGQGCCAADYDNDGDIDFYVSNMGPNVLFRNDGGGRFAEVAKAAGVDDPAWGQTCSFLDLDMDGWPDLYVQNYLTYSVDLQGEAVVYVGKRKVLDYPTPLDFPGSPDRFFRNLGNGAFRDVTEASGLLRSDGKGMGCACADLDDDGRPEIFVANDTMENFYFRRRGDGAYEEVALLAGLAFDGNGQPEASMGVDVGDFDLDGRIDIICPCLRAQGFTLYRNRGDHFEDASDAAGIARATANFTGFSPNFLDHDNDGDLDLFFTTGGVRANDSVPEDAPYIERYGFTDLLLANDGKGRYADVSSRAGPHFRRKTVGRGSAAGDLDEDGDVDLAISNLGDRAVLLRNETDSGHWVTVRLVPAKGSRDAFGASVWVEAGGVTRRAIVHGAVSYLSQNDRRLHFGLGATARIDRLTVRWPDGSSLVLEGLPADRVLVIDQAAGAAR
jgi:hypothetical protein